MPHHGRYVGEPAIFNDEGPTYVPPKGTNYFLIKLLVAGTMAAVGYFIYKKKNKVVGRALMTGSLGLLTKKLPTL